MQTVSDLPDSTRHSPPMPVRISARSETPSLADRPRWIFDCSDIGMHIINVQATDASGNTATCQTSLLIYDPVSVCEPCINFCPNPVAVTYRNRPPKPCFPYSAA